MPRAFTSSSLIVLPALSAADAIALANALAAAARPPKTVKGKAKKKVGAGVKLSPALSAALDELVGAAGALHKETSKVPEKPVLVKQADQAEDTAVGALHDLLLAWARLPSSVPGADAAHRLLDHLFADGAAFVRERVEREWAIVEGKLASIDAPVEADLALLGARPMLQHLKTVHATYGDVIGATEARPASGPTPQVRKKLDTLLASMRDYVLKAAASADAKKPETLTRRDALLAPLASWSATTTKKAKRPAPATAPTAPAATTSPSTS